MPHIITLKNGIIDHPDPEKCNVLLVIVADAIEWDASGKGLIEYKKDGKWSIIPIHNIEGVMNVTDEYISDRKQPTCHEEKRNRV